MNTQRRFRHFRVRPGILILAAASLLSPVLPASAAVDASKGDMPLTIIAPPSAEAMREYRLNLATRAMRARIIPLDREGNPVPVESDTLQNEMDQGRLGAEALHGWQIPVGTTRFIIEMADFFNIDRVFFLSTAKGEVRVKASEVLSPLDSGTWQKLAVADFSSAAPVREDFPATSARYLAFTFEITQAGEISGLGASGEDSLAQATTAFGGDPEALLAAMEDAPVTTPFDFAKLYSGATVTHISSGEWFTANDMLDDDNTTWHEFEPAPQSLMIIDIGMIYRYQLFSMIFEPGGGELEVYTFNMLPAGIQQGEIIDDTASTDGPRRIDLPSDFFDDIRPALTLTVEAEQTRTRADLMNTEARYFMVRWQPHGIGNPSYPPFKVFNISIIGDVAREYAFLDFIPLGDFLVETATALPTPPSPLAGPADLPPPVSP